MLDMAIQQTSSKLQEELEINKQPKTWREEKNPSLDIFVETLAPMAKEPSTDNLNVFSPETHN